VLIETSQRSTLTLLAFLQKVAYLVGVGMIRYYCEEIIKIMDSLLDDWGGGSAGEDLPI